MTRRYPQRLMILFFTSQFLLGGLVFQAAGQSVVMLEDDASRCTIFRALSAQVPPDCQGRFRSVVMQPSSAPVPAPALASVPLAQAPAPAPPERVYASSAPVPAPALASVPLAQAPAPAPPERVYAFATHIQFAFDSAQLTPDAYPLLDTLAAVLKDPHMAAKVVRIEGHTDTTGADEYNLLLSHRRAVAVQRYLRDRHGLLSARLPAVGRGESELYDLSHPTDAVNRRVQFVNVSDSGVR